MATGVHVRRRDRLAFLLRETEGTGDVEAHGLVGGDMPLDEVRRRDAIAVAEDQQRCGGTAAHGLVQDARLAESLVRLPHVLKANAA